MAKKIDEAILDLLKARKIAKETCSDKEKDLAMCQGYFKGIDDALTIIEEAAKDA